MEELKPCPFCGHQKLRVMSKTEVRRSMLGLVTYVDGYEGDEIESPMFDFRHAFYVRCNKCAARGPLVKTPWHERTEKESEDWSPSDKYWGFEPTSEWARPSKESAIEAWNTREKQTCRLKETGCATAICSVCGTEVLGSVVNNRPPDYVEQMHYCPACGAKVID